jgi:RNA polymerase sigma factor (sigma-70 family)
MNPTDIFIAPGMNVYENWRRVNKRLIRNLLDRFSQASREDAEDAIETAIELLLRKGLIFSEIAGHRKWIFVTASFCLLNERKRSSHRAPIEDAYEIEKDDELIQAFENSDLIDTALEILSEEDRELLLKKFRDGISIVDYAHTTGNPPTRLHKREQRALKRIRASREKA